MSSNITDPRTDVRAHADEAMATQLAGAIDTLRHYQVDPTDADAVIDCLRAHYHAGVQEIGSGCVEEYDVEIDIRDGHVWLSVWCWDPDGGAQAVENGDVIFVEAAAPTVEA